MSNFTCFSLYNPGLCIIYVFAIVPQKLTYLYDFDIREALSELTYIIIIMKLVSLSIYLNSHVLDNSILWLRQDAIVL